MCNVKVLIMKFTNKDHQRIRFVETAVQLAQSRIDQLKENKSTYPDEIVRNEDEIKELQEFIEDAQKMLKYRPSVYVLVEGGLVRGASSDSLAAIQVYDADCANTGNQEDDQEWIDQNGTPEEWDKFIRDGEEKGELINIY